MGLTPFKIMFALPPCIILDVQAKVIPGFNDCQLLDVLKGVQWAHKHVLPKPHVLYETGPPQPGVLKGLCIIILTTPINLKVNGITAWIHHTPVGS